jgi:hypothetical protein
MCGPEHAARYRGTSAEDAMLQGGGKYENACTAAREITGGTVLLIVTNGKQGHGFSVQTTKLEDLLHLPAVLREVAQAMEERER